MFDLDAVLGEMDATWNGKPAPVQRPGPGQTLPDALNAPGVAPALRLVYCLEMLRSDHRLRLSCLTEAKSRLCSWTVKLHCYYALPVAWLLEQLNARFAFETPEFSAPSELCAAVQAQLSDVDAERNTNCYVEHGLFYLPTVTYHALAVRLDSLGARVARATAIPRLGPWSTEGL